MGMNHQLWGRVLPRGDVLATEVWVGRHRGFIALLWAQALGLFVFAIFRGFGVLHAAVESGGVAMCALLANRPLPRHIRAGIVTFGLLSSSAILVHLSGGTIEAHFHFFVMITLITLYQSWWPFLLSIAYVLIHHGVIGVLDPMSVYNHPAAIGNPVKWALVHGAFILAASVAGLIVWKRNEDMRDMQIDLRRRHALLLNDDVIQGLVVAKMAAEVGEPWTTKESLGRTLQRAQEIATELIDDLNDGLGPRAGDLIRDRTL